MDVLVNNAAVRREAPLSAISFEDWRAVIASILDASFLCAQAAAATMPDGGRIINLGGLSAHAGASDRAHVVAAKAGLVGLTKGLAVELAPRGITVNLVAPGRIATDRRASGSGEPKHHQVHRIAARHRGLAGGRRSDRAPPGRARRAATSRGRRFHVNGGIYMP